MPTNPAAAPEFTDPEAVAPPEPKKKTKPTQKRKVKVRRAKKASGPVEPVKAVKPHPAIYRLALELAQGDRSRLDVLASDEILVRNQPK